MDVVTNVPANNESVDLPNPPAWIRQMAVMYRQAQRNLLQYQCLLGDAYDRSSAQIQTIERNYNALTDAIRYLYQQSQADQSASQDWVQTELIQVANAARDFTTDVWQEMAIHAEDIPRANHYQAVQLTHLDDALALLQSANHHQNQQQAAFQSNVENWAVRQEHTTTQLAVGQRRLATELAATQAALQRTPQQGAEGGSGNRPSPGDPLLWAQPAPLSPEGRSQETWKPWSNSSPGQLPPQWPASMPPPPKEPLVPKEKPC